MNPFKHSLNLNILLRILLCEHRQPLRSLLMRDEHLPQAHKGIQNREVGLDSLFTVEDTGHHGRPLFRKHIGSVTPPTAAWL